MGGGAQGADSPPPYFTVALSRPPRASPGAGSRRQEPLPPWKEAEGARTGRPGEAWHLGLRAARARPSLTFDQGMLVRGGGASQHPQLWPDLVDSLLLNLERDGGGAGRWGRGEKLRPREGRGLA